MRRHVTCAGFHITDDEWDDLDAASRLQLLAAMLESRPPRFDTRAYEAYELRIETPRAA